MKERGLPIFNYSLINQSNGTVDIHVDGDIVDAPTQDILNNWYGDETSVSFRSFRNQIESANPKTLNLYVNSTGGHVGDAMAMHDYLNDLENKGVTVNRIGRGIIASAATYLLVGNNSTMTENSWFMIHNVGGGIWGDVNTIENYAKMMRKFNNAIRDFYAKVTNQEPEQISAMMNKETWMTAQEAKDKGFIKNVSGTENFKNAIKPEQWNFTNTAVLNSYNSFIKPEEMQNNTQKSIADSIREGFEKLLETVGIKNKAEDKNVVEALAGFTTNIENALKDAGKVDQEVINTAVANALKNIGQNDDFKSAISDALKNSITKDDLKTEIKNLVDNLAEKFGNNGGGGGKRKTEEQTRPRNRFSGREFWSE